MTADPTVVTAPPAVTQPVVPPVPTPAPTTPDPQQDVNTLPEWAREAITRANREAANYRTQVAELRPRAEQLTALEQASQTEAQRLAAAAAEAQAAAATATDLANKWQVAATHGITQEDFDLLGSGTLEEITARAVRISAMKAAQVAPVVPPAVPAPQTRPATLRPGASPSEVQNEDDAVLAALFGPPTTV